MAPLAEVVSAFLGGGKYLLAVWFIQVTATKYIPHALLHTVLPFRLIKTHQGYHRFVYFFIVILRHYSSTNGYQSGIHQL